MTTRYITKESKVCAGLDLQKFGEIRYIQGATQEGCFAYQDINDVLGDPIDWVGSGDSSILVTPGGPSGHTPSFSIVKSPDAGNILEKRANGIYVPQPTAQDTFVETVSPIIGSGSLVNPVGIDLCKMGEQIPILELGSPISLLSLNLDPGTKCPTVNIIGNQPPCAVPLAMVGLDGTLAPSIYYLDDFRILPPVEITESAEPAVHNVAQTGLFDMDQTITIELCNNTECRLLHYDVFADSGRTRFESDGGYQRWRKWARLSGPGMADGVVAGFSWDSNREAFFAFPTDTRRFIGELQPGECATWTMRIEAEILDFESTGTNQQVDSGRARLTAKGWYS